MAATAPATPAQPFALTLFGTPKHPVTGPFPGTWDGEQQLMTGPDGRPRTHADNITMTTGTSHGIPNEEETGAFLGAR